MEERKSETKDEREHHQKMPQAGQRQTKRNAVWQAHREAERDREWG